MKSLSLGDLLKVEEVLNLMEKEFVEMMGVVKFLNLLIMKEMMVFVEMMEWMGAVELLSENLLKEEKKKID